MTSQVSLDLSDLLSPEEREEYASLLHEVRVFKDHFYKAGKALAIIRDKRLYREKYKTFEEFCLMEVKFSKSHTHRIIHGCETIEHIAEGVKPSSERVARELNKAPPASQKRIWKRALEISPKPSASVVHKATTEIAPETQYPDAELIQRLRAVRKLLSVPIDRSRIRPFMMSEIIGSIAAIVSSLRTTLSSLMKRRVKHLL